LLNNEIFCKECRMKKYLSKAVVAVALIVGAGAAPASAFAAYDYEQAWDPTTGKPVTVCVNCWFISCDCHLIPT
jgi:hypothetical protein